MGERQRIRRGVIIEFLEFPPKRMNADSTAMNKDLPSGFRFVPTPRLEEEVAALIDPSGTRYDVCLPDRFQKDGSEFVQAVYDAIRTTTRYSTGWDGYFDVLCGVWEEHYEPAPWVFVLSNAACSR
jgi:hypothetical protein